MGVERIFGMGLKAIVVALGLLVASPAALAERQPYMKSSRVDMRVPAHCRPLSFENFRNFPTDYDESTYRYPTDAPALRDKLILVSIDGAFESGFTHQYDMKRQDASRLWGFLKQWRRDHGAAIAEVRKSETPVARGLQLWAESLTAFEEEFGEESHYEELHNHFLRLFVPTLMADFTFGNEGDILEALVADAYSNPETSDGKTIAQTYPRSQYYLSGGYEYGWQGGRTVGELDIVIGKKADCSVIAIGETKLGTRSLRKAKDQVKRFVDFLADFQNQ